MYRSLDLRSWVQIADGYREYRHLHPLHEVVKAPMLLGYPNFLASKTLAVASGGLDEYLSDADVVMVREPWQFARVSEKTPADTPLVFSSHNVETERFADIEQPVFADTVVDWVDNLERRAVEQSDAIVCTSERDAAVYRDRYDVDGPMIVAANGTYESGLRDHGSESREREAVRSRYGIESDATVCIFMGSNYRPNVRAGERILRLARQFQDSDSPVHFLILGSVGRALQSQSLPENVTITGYVTGDFEAHFDAADIALNPMERGGGTNIKLIDYFARSLPVVSTPFGVRGLDVTDGSEVYLSVIDEFSAAIRSLRTDATKREQIGKAGRRLAEAELTWEAASRHLRTRLDELFGPF